MRNKIFFFTIIFSIITTSCSLLKYEVITYSYDGMYLKLYSNNSFKILKYIGSDIVTYEHKHKISTIFKGEYQKADDKLILNYEKYNLTDTLYQVIWSENVFMMDKSNILSLANSLNNKRVENYFGDFGWKDDTTKYIPVNGLPIFPIPFNKCIIKDSIFAIVTNIENDSISFTINKGLEAGIFWGCELTDGKVYYSTNEVFADSSVLMPSYLFDLIELNRKYGEDFISKSEINQIKITKRKEIKPKYLYIKGSI